MSYEIVRDRRFIKVDDNKYIPIILSGSSNCTQINYATGREVLERNWNIFWGAKDIITTKEQMIDWAKSCIENHSADYEVEWFKQGGSWVTGEKIYKWIENGCKNAHTVEEYIDLARTSLHCEIVLYSDMGDTSFRWEKKNGKYIKTTKELIEWIDEYNSFDKGTANEKYINIAFSGTKPLKIDSPIKETVFEKPFICKVGKQYIVDYRNEGFRQGVTYSRDIKQAKVYDSKEDFDNIQKLCRQYNLSTVKAVSADIKDVVKPYVIQISEGSLSGYFVKKLTRNHLHYQYNANNDIIHFATEAQAQKYADNLTNNHNFENARCFKVLRIEG